MRDPTPPHALDQPLRVHLGAILRRRVLHVRHLFAGPQIHHGLLPDADRHLSVRERHGGEPRYFRGSAQRSRPPLGHVAPRGWARAGRVRRHVVGGQRAVGPTCILAGGYHLF